MTPAAVAAAVVRWQTQFGRHDLPWQRDRSAYRVWVSEIMLQQTQVSTVRPYFERFMRRFPDVLALADAELDQVLEQWSGLGYYARGRNLHRAAQRIAREHAGQLPLRFDALADLPGIGRSTAGAILALADGQRHPILDGNARRVLARCFAVPGIAGQGATDKKLWSLATRCTPASDVAAYTQGIMDLGASVCVRARPKCDACPLQSGCAAHRSGREGHFPQRRARGVRPLRKVLMLLVIRHDGRVLLQQRPERGIWGGLWSLPEFDSTAAARRFGSERLFDPAFAARSSSPWVHAFTHFDLQIRSLHVHCRGIRRAPATPALRWQHPQGASPVGLPTPTRRLLAALAAGTP